MSKSLLSVQSAAKNNNNEEKKMFKKNKTLLPEAVKCKLSADLGGLMALNSI